jgi:hypothetical protein
MKYFITTCFSVLIITIISCDGLSTKSKQETRGVVWQNNEKGDSVLMRYSNEGRLLSFTTYKNGKKNGLAKKFRDDGNLEFVIHYRDGLHHGISQWYYENGMLYRETNYKAGLIDGVQKKYYETGNLMAEIPYKNGTIQAGLKEYNKSGKLKKKYPTLVIEAIDKLAFENKYILRCYLSNKSKNAKFSRRIDADAIDRVLTVPVENINGFADIVFIIPRGGYLMGKEFIRAEFKTSLGNTYIIEKEYNIAVDN